MLLTSFDYSINLHYCQDNFAGISFTDDAKNCSDKKSACSSMKKVFSDKEDPNCCKNKKIHIDDLDKDYTSPVMFDLVDRSFDLIEAGDFSVLCTNYGKQVIAYTSYRPPPPDIDYQAQYQIFII